MSKVASCAYCKPEPAGLSAADIEDCARRLAEQQQFDCRRDEVRTLAEKLGGRVECLAMEEFRELESGALYVAGENDFLIRLPAFTGPLRDNFTIAHELGHYCLHSGSPPGSIPIQVGRWGTDQVEREANRFAAALLMPKEPFTEVWNQYAEAGQPLRDVVQLAAASFNVSPRAAITRAASLKMITQDELNEWLQAGKAA